MAVQKVNIIFDVNDKDLEKVKGLIRQIAKATGKTEDEIEGLNNELKQTGKAARLAGRNVKAIGPAAKTATTGMKTLGAAARTLGPIMIGLFAVDKIVQFGKESARLADIQLTAESKIKTAIQSTNAAAGKSFSELAKMASDLQKNSLFGDEEILTKATATLLTFTKISGDTFDQAQQSAVDYAAFMGTDLQSAAVQVGKALNEPVQGISALSRAGIQFSDEQKNTIKRLSETNRVAEAQGIILKELEVQFGGAAAAAAAAGLGPFDQFKMAIGDIMEEVGKRLIPAINSTVKFFTRIIENAEPVTGAFSKIGDAIGGIVSGTTRLLQGLGLVSPEIDGVKEGMELWGKAIEFLQTPFRWLLQGIEWMVSTGLPVFISGFSALQAAGQSVFESLAKGAQGVVLIMQGQFKPGLKLLTDSVNDFGKNASESMDRAFSNSMDRFKEKTEQAKKETDLLGKAAKKTGNEITNNLGGAVDYARGSLAELEAKLSKTRETLKNTTIGTKEWYSAIIDVNDATKELEFQTEKLKQKLEGFQNIDAKEILSIDPEKAKEVGERVAGDMFEGVNEFFENNPVDPADMVGEKTKKTREEKINDTLTNLGYAGEITDSIGGLFDQINNIRTQKLEEQISKENEINEINRQNELSRYGNSEKDKQRINAKFDAIAAANQKKADRERARIQTEQARKDKAQAIFKSIISTAAGIASALPNIALSVITGILGAAQTAAIAATPIPKFKAGVIDLKGPGTGTSDSISARLSRGESVMTAEETQLYKPTLQAIREKKISPGVLNNISMNGGSRAPVVNVDNSEIAKSIEGIPVSVMRYDEFGHAKYIQAKNSKTEILNRKYSF